MSVCDDLSIRKTFHDVLSEVSGWSDPDKHADIPAVSRHRDRCPEHNLRRIT